MNYEVANALLAKGWSVRKVADYFGVTTQAVYSAIAAGHVRRLEPAVD